MDKKPICPTCGSDKLMVERRPNGNATCTGSCGKTFPYADCFHIPKEKKTMTVYIVQGSTGEYEDYREWIAKIFADKSLAETYLSELTDILKNYRAHGQPHVYKKMQELDNKYYSDGVVSYTIIEEELLV